MCQNSLTACDLESYFTAQITALHLKYGKWQWWNEHKMSSCSPLSFSFLLLLWLYNSTRSTNHNTQSRFWPEDRIHVRLHSHSAQVVLYLESVQRFFFSSPYLSLTKNDFRLSLFLPVRSPYHTNFMKQNASWEVNNLSAALEISRFCLNKKAHYCVHNSPLASILSQMTPVHFLISWLRL
jgi:hypothetical protein